MDDFDPLSKMRNVNASLFQGVIDRNNEINNYTVTDEFKCSSAISERVLRGIVFEKDVIFRNHVKFIEFIDCAFQVLSFQDAQVNHVKLIDCSFTRLVFNNLKGREIILEVSNKEINQELSSLMSDACIFKSISLRNLNYLDLNFNQSPIDSFTINSNQPNKKPNNGIVKFTDSNITQLLEFRNQCIGQLVIDGKSRLTNFQLFNGSVSDMLVHYEALVSNLTFNNCSISKILRVSGILGNLNIIDAHHHDIQLAPKVFSSVNISQENQVQPLTINAFELANYKGTSVANISIKNSQIKNFTYSRIEENVTLNLSDSSIKTRLVLSNSNLKNASFRNVDLSECTDIQLLNSALTEAKFFNVRWNTDYTIYEYQNEIAEQKSLEEGLNKFLWPVKEAYRQLKMVSLAEHNKIDATFFGRRELSIYQKIISIKKKQNWKANIWDHLVLWTNKTFSDFGLSWIRPLVYLLLIHTTLISLLFLEKNIPYRFTINPNLSDSLEAIGFYLTMISPVHSSEVLGNQVTGVTDFFIRISSAYFIYYFLRGTRKFSST